MTFSRRSGWDLEPNEISRAIGAHRAAGRELLDLTEGNPTRAGLGPDPARLREAMALPGIERYEPDPRGLASAREAVAAWHRARGDVMDADRLVLTASTSEAYSWIFKLLCDPGDEVLVPAPGYPLFDFLAGLESISTKSYPLRDPGGWHLDPAALEAACGPRTRAVVLVSPGNPTGSYVKASELDALTAIAKARGLAIVSDEVFRPFRLAPGAEPSAASDGVLTFVLGGFSKLLALPQVKLGWISVHGPADATAEALARLEVIADTFLSVGTPVQLAAPRLLSLAGGVQEAILARLRANLAALRGALSGSAASVLPPEGGWYAVLRVPRLFDDERWVLELLDGEGVLVQPGSFFDFEAQGFLIVSLLAEPSVFARGAEKIATHVAKVAPPHGA